MTRLKKLVLVRAKVTREVLDKLHTLSQGKSFYFQSECSNVIFDIDELEVLVNDEEDGHGSNYGETSTEFYQILESKQIYASELKSLDVSHIELYA